MKQKKETLRKKRVYRNYISDEELLEDLKRVAAKLKKTPTVKDIKQYGKYGAVTYYNRFKGNSNALRLAGMNPPNERAVITDEELLEDLRRLQKETGKAPAFRDVTRHGKYSCWHYFRRFASFTNALKLAGMNPPEKVVITNEELLAELTRLANELHKTPTTIDIENRGKYALHKYYRHFGSLKTAREKAGLINHTRQYTQEELLADLKRLADELKQVPVIDAIKKYGKYSINAYNNHFGGIVNARKKAGLGSAKDNRYTNKELLEDLKRMASELNRTPMTKDIIKHGKYPCSAYSNRLGSIKMAREKAGLPQPEPEHVRKHTEEELLNDLKRLSLKLNKTPSVADIIKYGKYDKDNYNRYFGGIIKAREKAGLSNEKTYPYTEELLLAELRQLATELKRTPTFDDILKHGKYSLWVYRKHFGSILKAREKAGLDNIRVYASDSKGILNAPPRKYTEEELLNDLKRLNRKLKRVPGTADIMKYGKYDKDNYNRYFGSIVKAREKAGLGKEQRAYPYTEEDLLTELKRLAAKLKRKPSSKDVKKHGKYSISVYYRCFGSIVKAREKGGI